MLGRQIMIPSPWIGVVLALATFRVVRLIGWDDFPPFVRARNWVTGAKAGTRSTSNSALGVTREQPEVTWRYKRPLLADMISCAYCFGFWVSLVAYIAWRFAPTETLYIAAPFALSGAVGITARMLDP